MSLLQKVVAVVSSTSNKLSSSSSPIDRLCRLHQDLLLLVHEEDEALAKRFRPREPSWREKLERFLQGSEDNNNDNNITMSSTGSAKESCVSPNNRSPSSPQSKMNIAALSFRENLIKMTYSSSSSDDGNEDVTASTNATAATAADPPCLLSWNDLEQALVDAIREIGRLVVDSQPLPNSPSTGTGTCTGMLRSDPVFEYFCETAMLPLLVDIAQEKPRELLDKEHKQDGRVDVSSNTTFHRIVWSPTVKAQVLETISLLVSSLRDVSALYFILSQNCINQLLSSLLPLHQWTDPAMQRLLPPFVNLLKHLTLQLTASPHLFPCFVDRRRNEEELFPLLTALLETATFAYAQSDSFVHASCLNSIVSLLRLVPVQQWVTLQQQQLQQKQQQSIKTKDTPLQPRDDEKKEESSTSTSSPQTLSLPTPSSCRLAVAPHVVLTLASHLTLLFINRFERLVTLTEGPVVNTVRSNAIAGQIGNFNDQIDFLNDIFDAASSSTSVVSRSRSHKNRNVYGAGSSRSGAISPSYMLWNICICEKLLQGFLSRLLLALDNSNSSCNGGSSGSGSSSAAALSSTSSGATATVQQGFYHQKHHVLLNCGADVGVMDADVIPEPEARAQVATLCLTRLMDRVEFLPLKRMLAVAMFHPQSTTLWWQQQQHPYFLDNKKHIFDQNNGAEEGKATSSSHNSKKQNYTSSYQYVLTPALNAIAKGSSNTTGSSSGINNQDKNNTLIENPYRRELLRALQGDYGEYRFIPTAMLVEASLHALDPETLEALNILEAIQESLSSFLARRQHQLKSVVSSIALQSAASLAVQVYCILATRMISQDSSRTQNPNANTTTTTTTTTTEAIVTEETASTGGNLENIPIRNALEMARDYFFGKTLESQQVPQVSNMLVDLVESAARTWYTQTTLPIVQGGGISGPMVYAFVLSRHHCGSHPYNEALIRKMRGVPRNDVEETRFFAEMAIFYRACCRLVDRYADKLQQHKQSTVAAMKKPSMPNSTTVHHALPVFDPLDMADELAQLFSTIREKPDMGTDLDLRERNAFTFHSPAAAAAAAAARPSSCTHGNNRPRTRSEDMILGSSSSQLLLVLDPSELFVVKPLVRRQRFDASSSNIKTHCSTAPRRGTIICCIPLLNVIAAAADQEWLHVAVVRHPDVPFLIKNGNLALRFESSGTCHIVWQYLERCRHVLRADLVQHIEGLFQGSSAANSATGSTAMNTGATQEDIPHDGSCSELLAQVNADRQEENIPQRQSPDCQVDPPPQPEPDRGIC